MNGSFFGSRWRGSLFGLGLRPAPSRLPPRLLIGGASSVSASMFNAVLPLSVVTLGVQIGGVRRLITRTCAIDRNYNYFLA